MSPVEVAPSIQPMSFLVSVEQTSNGKSQRRRELPAATAENPLTRSAGLEVSATDGNAVVTGNVGSTKATG